MSENKKTLKVTVDGQEICVAVLRPSHKVQQQAHTVYNRAFREAVDPGDGQKGALVRAKLESVLREQHLWDDAKQARYETAVTRLLDNEKRLAKGGIKLSEARELAVQMRRDRLELRLLNSDRNQLDQHTAEAQAENAKFNFQVSACTVYADTGKPYYRDYDDYLGRADDPVTPQAAQALGKMLYGLEDDFEHKLPENRLLRKFGFCNEELHLVDNQGRLINTDGHLVDEQGRLINEQGELVDGDGNRLSEDGDYLVEFSPFLDDDGNAIAEDVPAPEVVEPVAV